MLSGPVRVETKRRALLPEGCVSAHPALKLFLWLPSEQDQAEAAHAGLPRRLTGGWAAVRGLREVRGAHRDLLEFTASETSARPQTVRRGVPGSRSRFLVPGEAKKRSKAKTLHCTWLVKGTASRELIRMVWSHQQQARKG